MKEEEKRELPPIRQGKEVKDDEPKVCLGRKRAALPPPSKVKESEI